MSTFPHTNILTRIKYLKKVSFIMKDSSRKCLSLYAKSVLHGPPRCKDHLFLQFWVTNFKNCNVNYLFEKQNADLIDSIRILYGFFPQIPHGPFLFNFLKNHNLSFNNWIFPSMDEKSRKYCVVGFNLTDFKFIFI